jgi:hypothetical protein
VRSQVLCQCRLPLPHGRGSVKISRGWKVSRGLKDIADVCLTGPETNSGDVRSRNLLFWRTPKSEYCLFANSIWLIFN